MKISVSTKFAERSREGIFGICESFELIKNAGFDAVEVDLSRGIGGAALESDNWKDGMISIRNAANEAGLEIISAHAPHDPRLYIPETAPTAEERARFDALLERSAEAAKLLGAGILVVHPVDDLINAEYDSEVNLETNKKYLGGVIAEALACGVPVITTDICGYASLIRESGAGLILASPYSNASLADAWQKWYNCREDFSGLARQAAVSLPLKSRTSAAVDFILQHSKPGQ